MKIRKVDDAINEILRREKWFSRKIFGREQQFVTIRIQDIARHMHPRYGYFCGENDMLELKRVGK